MGRFLVAGSKGESDEAFRVGARVVEPTYGLGSVIAVEDAYTRVQFDEHGVKKFMTSMSKLEPSNEPVPRACARQAPQEAHGPKRRPRPRLSPNNSAAVCDFTVGTTGEQRAR